MNTLKLQDVFEPYYEGRAGVFANIDPKAVEKAKQRKDQIEGARGTDRFNDNSRDRAA